MTIVRLTRARYSPKDPTGAKLRGGRWNSPGKSILYASSTLSLACLEVLVHIRDVGLIPTDYVWCEIDVQDSMVGQWAVSGEAALARIESPVLSREYGDRWFSRTMSGMTALNLAEHSPEDWPIKCDIEAIAASLEGLGEAGPLAPPVQAVPSVIIPREMNFLISTVHPQFNELVWSEPKPFRFDPRLIAAAE